MIGRTLGHYRIVDRLGSGGMGVVWLAEDLKLGRKVALKVLREDLADSPEKAARFEREARAIAALAHPSIVTLHAVEEIDGVRFLAMEHLEGRTLDQLVREGPLPVAELLRIAIPIAEALEAAHARGILHRDLKPSNVMVCADGRVKVLDFGLAKLLEDPAKPVDGKNETTLTREGQVVGTLHYSSPEQLQQKPVDARTDIYSFGAVLYEMATGQVPFQGDSAAQVITGVLCDVPRRIDEVESSVPKELADLVVLCLLKEKERRPMAVSSIEPGLRALARNPALAQGRTRRWLRTNRRVPGQRAGSLLRTGLLAVSGGVLVLAFATMLPERRVGIGHASSSAVDRSVVTAAGVPSIVVLPARGTGAEPDYLLDGVTDGIISTLGRRADLRVISRQSAMHFRGSSKSPRQIAEELSVEFVADVQVDGESIGVSTRILLTRSGPASGSREFGVDAANAYEASERTAELLARMIGARSGEPTGDSASRAIAPGAYEAYLRGRFHSFRFDRDSRAKAESEFRRAIEIDPGFAPAWVGLAESQHLNSQTWISPVQQRAEALAAIEKAIALDSGLASAHSLRSQLMQERMEWAEAERSIRRAIELEPNSAETRRRHWMLLVCLLRIEEAEGEILAARRLDPLSAVISGDVALQHIFEGRFDEALAELDRTAELDPSYPPADAYRFFVHFERGEDPGRGEGLRGFLEGLGLQRYLPEYDRRLAQDGFEGALRWIAYQLAEDPLVHDTTPGFPAGLLAHAGEIDRALDLLEYGAEVKSWELAWLAVDPSYWNLHGHPRFERVLARLGLPIPRSRRTPRSVTNRPT